MSSEQTRDLILRTAWRLLQDDAAHASMSRVAREAGLSRQGVYLHFESWAGLLLALVRWIDERERFTEALQPILALAAPRARLAGLIQVWLDYLPRLHPVPGHLARARQDTAATAAWGDRMAALGALYREPLDTLDREGALCDGLSTDAAVDLVLAIASVHAWEQLVHQRGWTQAQAASALSSAAVRAVCRDV